MDIQINSVEDEDCSTHDQLLINGKEVLSVHPLHECPEDAIIGRDLVSCSDVLNLMQLAYDVGKKGDSFNVTTGEYDLDS